MEAKALTVVTPRAFRSGETPHLEDHHAEPREAHLHRLQAQRRGVLPQEARARRTSSRSTSAWSPPTPSGPADVPGYAKYKPVETTYELKKLERAGRLRRQGHRREDAPGDDPGARQRPRRDRQDLARAGARLRPGHEDRQGPARGAGAGRRRPGRSSSRPKTGRRRRPAARLGQAARGRTPRCTYLVLDGADVAGSGLGVPDKVAQGLTPRAYLYTDRPAYRPGQQVALRGRGPRGRRTASTPTSPRPSIASRSPTAGAGSSSPGR